MNHSEKTQSITIHEATEKMRAFVAEREWQKFHTPRNLVLALAGQVGQVAQIFQWKGEVSSGLKELSQKEKVHVGEELADVFSYVIRLSDECGVDLSQAFLNKMEKNAQKYPKEMVKGSSKKYTQYKTKWNQEQASKQEDKKDKQQ